MDKGRNYARFYALLSGMEGAEKELIICQYTAGRTDSLKEMTELEYMTMVNDLKHQSNTNRRLKNKRHEVLDLIQRYGIKTTKDNWDEINRFVSQPRIAGKVFAKLTIPELNALSRKLRSILDKGERKAMQDEIDRYNQQVVASARHNQRPS